MAATDQRPPRTGAPADDRACARRLRRRLRLERGHRAAVVATGDKAAGADLVRAQAQRAGADILEVEGSHVIMISQPQTVTGHILKAAQALADPPRQATVSTALR